MHQISKQVHWTWKIEKEAKRQMKMLKKKAYTMKALFQKKSTSMKQKVPYRYVTHASAYKYIPVSTSTLYGLVYMYISLRASTCK